MSSWGFEAQGVHLPLFFANLGTENLLIFNTFWGECGNSCGVSTGKRYFWEGVAAMLTGSGEGGMGIFFRFSTRDSGPRVSCRGVERSGQTVYYFLIEKLHPRLVYRKLGAGKGMMIFKRPGTEGRRRAVFAYF